MRSSTAAARTATGGAVRVAQLQQELAIVRLDLSGALQELGCLAEALAFLRVDLRGLPEQPRLDLIVL